MPCNVKWGVGSQKAASFLPVEDFLLLCLPNLTIASIHITFFLFCRNCLVRAKEQLRNFLKGIDLAQFTSGFGRLSCSLQSCPLRGRDPLAGVPGEHCSRSRLSASHRKGIQEAEG